MSALHKNLGRLFSLQVAKRLEALTETELKFAAALVIKT